MQRARLYSFGALALVTGAICVRLGVWQLSRLRERRASNAAVAARLVASPVPIDSLPAALDAARWRRVRIEGTYDYAREALLGTRIYKGSPGAWLLTPLRRPGTDTVVFVNRGWVYAADGRTVDRARWTEDAIASGGGYVETFPALHARSVANTAGDTIVLRHLDRDALARRVGAPVAPYYVVLLDDSLGGVAAPVRAAAGPVRSVAELPGRLPRPAMDEGSHMSYAIQWFSFALIAVVGVGGLVVSERRRAGAPSAVRPGGPSRA